jgi:hypothetical protein
MGLDFWNKIKVNGPYHRHISLKPTNFYIILVSHNWHFEPNYFVGLRDGLQQLLSKTCVTYASVDWPTWQAAISKESWYEMLKGFGHVDLNARSLIPKNLLATVSVVMQSDLFFIVTLSVVMHSVTLICCMSLFRVSWCLPVAQKYVFCLLRWE